MRYLCGNLRAKTIIFEYKLRHVMARVRYSAVYNKQAGFNKQAGRKFSSIQISKQDLIRASRLEK